MRNWTLVYLLIVLSWHYSFGQVDYDVFPQVSKTFFLENVYVYQGQIPTSTTNIVVKDGLIHEIGKSIKQPKGSRKLEVDSMYVYPAFIDILSHTGMSPESEKEKEGEKVKFPGLPPDPIAGITPNLSSLAYLNDNPADFSKMLENGFAIAQLSFNKGMLPGSTAIIALTEDKSLHIFQTQENQYFQLQGARGVYPSTVIGVMAKFRDLYRNAEQYNKAVASFKSSKNPSTPPQTTTAIAALSALADKQQTLFVLAPKKLDALRAIQLQKELGFKMVLVGIEDITGLEDRILQSKVPLALSLKLPEEVKQDSTKKDTIEVAFSAELDSLKAKKMRAYQAVMHTPATLEAQRVPFAFCLSKESPSNTKKALKRLVDSGLTQTAAINALTINPAGILGISNRVGTIEEGKMAHLMITDGEYFEDDSNVRCMVLGGEFHTYEKQKKETKAANKDLDIEGLWDFVVETPDGDESGTIRYAKSEDTYTLILTTESDQEKETIKDVSLSGDTMEYSFTVSEQGMSIDITITQTFASSEVFKGSVKYGEFGSYPITGSKKKPN